MRVFPWPSIKHIWGWGFSWTNELGVPKVAPPNQVRGLPGETLPNPAFGFMSDTWNENLSPLVWDFASLYEWYLEWKPELFGFLVGHDAYDENSSQEKITLGGGQVTLRFDIECYAA